jgi:hypothetical protein
MAEDESGGEAKLAQAQAEANASLEAKKNEVQKGVADAMQKAEAMKEGSLVSGLPLPACCRNTCSLICLFVFVSLLKSMNQMTSRS